MEVENNSLARLEVRPCAQCKHEMSNLGTVQKGTDYLTDNISESDLVCRVGRPPLLFNVLDCILNRVFFLCCSPEILSVCWGRDNVYGSLLD